jgi:hypothetical protein
MTPIGQPWEFPAMRRFLLAVTTAAALGLASAANGAIVIASNLPGTDPYSGPTPTYTFDTLAGTPTFTGGAVVSGTSLAHAQPFGSTGSYYSVGLTDGPTGVIDLSSFGDISTIGLLWGSVDAYNTLQFLDGSNNVLASFDGAAIINPADGNQSDPDTNRLVTFLLTGADVSAFSQLRLTSNNNAFEIDNLTINSPVPEPAAWALMMVGFLLLGAAMRRRRPRLSQVA